MINKFRKNIILPSHPKFILNVSKELAKERINIFYHGKNVKKLNLRTITSFEEILDFPNNNGKLISNLILKKKKLQLSFHLF